MYTKGGFVSRAPTICSGQSHNGCLHTRYLEVAQCMRLGAWAVPMWCFRPRGIPGEPMTFSPRWKAEEAGLRRQQRTAATTAGQGQPQGKEAANTVDTLTRRGSCTPATVRAPSDALTSGLPQRCHPRVQWVSPLQLT